MSFVALTSFSTSYGLIYTRYNSKTPGASGIVIRMPSYKPKTPYARTLLNHEVSEQDKDLLRETYELLDLLDVRQQIDQLQAQIVSSKSAR